MQQPWWEGEIRYIFFSNHQRCKIDIFYVLVNSFFLKMETRQEVSIFHVISDNQYSIKKPKSSYTDIKKGVRGRCTPLRRRLYIQMR